MDAAPELAQMFEFICYYKYFVPDGALNPGFLE
jgi:hypothetical protein